MASTYKTVSYGSTGESVRKLQTELNKKGYGLDVDGVFGEKTRAAVRDYQKKNNLLLDGIAGDETWAHLTATNAKVTKPTTGKQVLSGVSDETADALSRLEQGYTPSDETAAALALWQSAEALKPGDYESSYAEQLAALYDEIEKRPAFAYDFEEDPEYAGYAAMYTRQGQRAMEDTLGKASALTGGYDSSYAQLAGQQAYGEYLRELSALIPELAENARETYDREGDSLLEQVKLLQSEDEADYQRWLDKQKLWRDDADAAQENYNALNKQDYSSYETLLSHYLAKAKSEQAASDGTVSNTGKTAKKEKQESLSSTASDSLQRAMNNYLSAGQSDSAVALLRKYAERMTPAQKKSFTALFKKYGMAAGI